MGSTFAFPTPPTSPMDGAFAKHALLGAGGALDFSSLGLELASMEAGDEKEEGRRGWGVDGVYVV